MLENNRDEDVCRKWDDLAEEDHTYQTASVHGDPHVEHDPWALVSKVSPRDLCPVAVFVPISLRIHYWQRTVPILYLSTTNGEHCTGDAIEMSTPQAW